ncbi:hypothetical protein [Microbulbifer thermotolerans]|uniref:hypothetical protein n=1 Tax=Microbulbifer thermotolerans TaxID=252514 RepID=UPI00224B37B6|nr:hypothetical protein [Microbulbifer thermotolerans]MCX2778454.1 hypothetical protein [Microbulbifer thermotolerans]MCX2805621.1 hypothetical protein [Microbulbifer thermotolerans]
MFSNNAVRREIRIAGHHAGKPVTITPQADPIYRELVKLARRGNYWAVLTVNGIHQLAAGRLHQNNIFVKPDAVHRDGTEEFVVILPGCRVTAEKRPDGSYRVLYMQADLNYSELMDRAEKPGLYEATKDGDEWQASLKKKGKIAEREDRLVAISDSGYRNPDKAASMSASRIAEAPFSGGGLRVEKNGFDMHFTPGNKRIGGLINYRDSVRPLDNTKLYESALLLAKTMYDARKIKGVGWIAEFGGSAVLTQALKILADRGVRLENHTAFLVRPRTSPNEAIKAAHAVGLKLDRKFSKTHMLDYIGNRDQLELIFNRWRKEDGYTGLKAITDMVEHSKSLQGAGAFMGSLAAVAGLSASAPAPAAAAAFLTALGAAVGSAATIGKMGNTMVSAWLPNQHNKLKSKF